jgi:plasmid stabilization system protein ParE
MGNAGLQSPGSIMKIEWSAAALADLDRFAKFLQKDFPSLATIVAEEIIAKTDMITANPRLGRVLDERKAFRQIVLRVLNAAYVLQYRYDGKRLVVLRVFHSREQR